jgi:hypothetical protein
MRQVFGKITSMLTRTAADFPNGCGLAKNRSNNL